MDKSDKQMTDASSILRTQYSVLSIQYLILALFVSGLAPFSARRMLIASDQPTNAEKPIDAKLNAEAETPNSAPGNGPTIKGRTADDNLDLQSAKDSIIIPPGRPTWTEERPSTASAVHRLPVASGPYARQTDAKRALDKALVAEVNRYVAETLGSDLAPRFIHYEAGEIRHDLHLVKESNEYHDRATYGVGPMYEYFALLEIGPDFRNALEARWTGVRANWRLVETGFFAAVGLLLVASVFSYFRLDNATRGYYTGRLQFLTAAAILAIVGAGAIVAQWIHWL